MSALVSYHRSVWSCRSLLALCNRHQVDVGHLIWLDRNRSGLMQRTNHLLVDELRSLVSYIRILLVSTDSRMLIVTSCANDIRRDSSVRSTLW